MRTAFGAAGLAAALAASPAFAADPEECATVRMADIGWTDITATTALTSTVLEGLGYEPDVQLLALPVTFQSLERGDLDVFLGNWMPSMEADIRPFLEAGTIETVRTNLEGAKYTLATTAGLAAALAASPAFAADPEECATVRLADIGWTDITATTAATTVVLEALGYETEVKVLSVPVSYQSLAAGDVEVFLGNWMPTMEADIAPYREEGTV